MSREKIILSISICNSVFLIAITVLLIWMGVSIVPKVAHMEEVSGKLGNVIDRVNQVIDKADNIPDVIWDFITNSTKLEEVFGTIDDIISQRANLRNFIQQIQRMVNQVDDLLIRADNIPNITWDFITNQTYQDKLIYIAEDIINHWSYEEIGNFFVAS